MRDTLSAVGVKLFGHCSKTADASKRRAHCKVRSHPRNTGSVSRNAPTSERDSGGNGCFSRRYVGLLASWVTSCHAFIVNSKSGGTADRHFPSNWSVGGS